MDSIRAQIAADALMQAEIGRGLIAVADSLPNGSDLRVARILARMLQSSWSEHVSFQDEVVFPILAVRRARRLAGLIGRQQTDHARLSQHHRAIEHQLNTLLVKATDDVSGLDRLLRGACDARRSHMAVDEQLDAWLPATFSDGEVRLYHLWANERPHPRFPLNLLKTRLRGVRNPGTLH
jgi:hypothetical protein